MSSSLRSVQGVYPRLQSKAMLPRWRPGRSKERKTNRLTLSYHTSLLEVPANRFDTGSLYYNILFPVRC